jgi:hypothetical protein
MAPAELVVALQRGADHFAAAVLAIGLVAGGLHAAAELGKDDFGES